MKKTSYLILFLLLPAFIYAQNIVINGKIIDKNQSPIPYGSVYLKNTSIATSANADGEFKLSVPTGNQTLVFKAIGYKMQEKTISASKNESLLIELVDEAFNIENVTITAGAEDPAYAIIRNAIKKRKQHLNEVKEFSTGVYIKGMQKMLQAPKKFLGQDIQKMSAEMGLDSNRQGIIYLSESESIYNFKAPNNVHEEMISSKVSGNNRAFSFNRASDLKVDFYENLQEWDGLSLRPLVSPIADNALFYYKYKYLGASEENGVTVFKIQVIPKRNSDPVYRGTLYIIDELWRLYDVNLVLSKEANLNFVDSLQVKQQFIPIKNNIWMPSTIQFDFVGGLFGFRFGGYFTAVFRDYDLDTRRDKKTYAEVMRVTADVNKKDSLYWIQNRPIPLTEEEKMDYEKKAILAAKRESKPYLDSLDKENNKFKISKVLIGGYRHINRYEKTMYSFSSLADAAFYNTVEGFGLNYSASYRKQIDSVRNKFLGLSVKLRYGFSSEKFYPSATANIPFKKFTLNLAGGADVLDLNNVANQSVLGNSLNSLIYERNFLKLYEKTYGFASINGILPGGIYASFFSEYADRSSLINTSDYKFKDWKNREFTSNNPFSPNLDVPLFPDNQSMKIGIRLSYNFSSKYITYPSGKYYIPSKYPTVTVGYNKGLPNILGSDVDYDFIYSEISKRNISLGFYGKFGFMVGAGKFLNNKYIFYPDFKHFNGNMSTLYTPGNNAFLFLNLYQHSIAKSYFEAHADHNFSGFILNKFPLIRKLKLEEIVGVNYLTTPHLTNYLEAYVGITHLSGFQLSYGQTFLNGKKDSNGIRVSFRL